MKILNNVLSSLKSASAQSVQLLFIKNESPMKTSRTIISTIISVFLLISVPQQVSAQINGTEVNTGTVNADTVGANAVNADTDSAGDFNTVGDY